MAIFVEVVSGDATGVEVYGGMAACTKYLLYASSAEAAAFRALGTDDQVRALAGATRYIEEQFWLGIATGLAGGVATTLAFPRSGLTDVNGAALDATNVPPQVVHAAFELTALAAADPTVLAAVDTGSNVASLGAGPAQIALFRPSSVLDGTATVMPTVVDRLIGRWRAAASTVVGGIITGASSRSDFRDFCTFCSTSPCMCSTGRRDIRWPL